MFVLVAPARVAAVRKDFVLALQPAEPDGQEWPVRGSQSEHWAARRPALNRSPTPMADAAEIPAGVPVIQMLFLETCLLSKLLLSGWLRCALMLAA